MQKQEFKVQKTARYFTEGVLSENTKEIWFVLHGYAQTADAFLESLSALKSDERFIVAPEGLSRFYWRDFVGEPVSSWMTKTDREIDIEDNVLYLNDLYLKITQEIDLGKVKIKFLGFSQGAATLSRWLFADVVKSSANYFYAGELAKELDYSLSQNFKNTSNYFIYGTKDFFIEPSKVEELKSNFKAKNLKLNIFTFEGKHQIHKDALDFIQQNKQNNEF